MSTGDAAADEAGTTTRRFIVRVPRNRARRFVVRLRRDRKPRRLPDQDPCPACGVVIRDNGQRELHAAGLDGHRLECSIQDVTAIREREQAAVSEWARLRW
ncbi:MAG TPA: hypothetical protein VMD09_10145 [Solirubrobacteraceae bacterium]|nr:hypothetical protein [Solirubrobacteraceae bacterium]